MPLVGTIEHQRGDSTAGWRFTLALLLPAGLFHASPTCMCHDGVVLTQATLAADAAVALRALVAVIRRENSRDWIPYALLLVFMRVVVRIAVGVGSGGIGLH